MNLFAKLAGLLSFALCASAVFAANEMLTFSDSSGDPLSGTYNPTDTFSLDGFATWNGYDAAGFSYWLEVPLALAPTIVITSATPYTFLTGGHIVNPISFTSTQGADAGYMLETPDLGAIGAGQTFPSGTYHVTTVNFSLNGAAPGTYFLRTTHIPSRVSEINDASFVSHNLVAQGTYTIVIVPEPATWSLIGLGALTLPWLRARRCS